MHTRPRLVIGVLAGLFFAIAIGTVACARMGAFVWVRNESSTELRNVVLLARGAQREIKKLPPGAVRLVRLAPRGESDLRVSFTSGSRRVESPEDCYFENSWLYTLDVRVRPSLEVTVKSGLIGM